MRALILVFGLLLAACGGEKSTPKLAAETVSAEPWSMDEASSRLSFITIKKGTIVEVHSFGQMTGEVAGGKLMVNIILDTVSTGIDIRDARMREHLFETNQFPFAKIDVLFVPNDYELMTIGEQRTITKSIDVSMHGQSFSYDVEIVLTRLGVNKVQIQSATPLVVEVSDFGFEAGVEKLRTLANLPAITPSVPVSFSLVFARD